MKVIYFSLAIFLFLGVLGLIYAITPSLRERSRSSRVGKYEDGTVWVHDVSFRVEIADSLGKRATGLSGRNNLPEGSGMFFVFSGADLHGFWMKDMKFPIDVVWIKDNRVAGVTQHLPPATDGNSPIIYYPPEPVNYVLEIPAGTAGFYGFLPGDEIRLVRNK